MLFINQLRDYGTWVAKNFGTDTQGPEHKVKSQIDHMITVSDAAAAAENILRRELDHDQLDLLGRILHG